ncbi:hypothetical protein BsWGS_08921 [Bradybaena similaris]
MNCYRSSSVLDTTCRGASAIQVQSARFKVHIHSSLYHELEDSHLKLRDGRRPPAAANGADLQSIQHSPETQLQESVAKHPGKKKLGMSTYRKHGAKQRGGRSCDPGDLKPTVFRTCAKASVFVREILLQLREKLKHQRALASSSGSTSQDTSATSETSSAGGPFPYPAHAASLSATDAARVLDRPRKIAASHTSPSYKGFSEVTSDVSSPYRLNPKLKKNDRLLKQPLLQPKKHDLESIKLTPQIASPDASKKMTRAPMSRKSAKPAVSNIITTSSWRAGQDLIMKELGLTPKVKRSSGQGEATHETRRTGTNTTPVASNNLLPNGSEGRQRRWQPDEGETCAAREETPAAASGAFDDRSNDKLDGANANTRVLSSDAKSVLNDVKQGNSEDSKLRSPQRPALKRKAPKTADPEKHQQPSEKTRHYDQESVRKFMAKQKAERLKRQHEEKIAHQKANERRQQILHELAEKQKQAAKRSIPVRGGEGDRKRKSSEGGNKENMQFGQHDQDDNSTMTEDSEDSTPQTVPGGMEEDGNRQRKRSKDNEVGVNTNQHAHNMQTIAPTQSTSVSAASGESAGRGTAQAHGQNVHLDVESILSYFSQVVKQRQSHEPSEADSATSNDRLASTSLPEFQLQVNNVFNRPRNPDDADIAFSLGISNSMAKTIEERRQAIKATAMTLQNRLVEEKLKMAVLSRKNQIPQGANTGFLSRYDRIAGKGNDFAVFTSDLPGSHVVAGGTSSPDEEKEAATRIQAAYRGHTVRRMLNWELPSGQTFQQSLRHSQKNKQKSQAADNDDDEDVSGLTETSTFSEITSAEGSDVAGLVNISGNKRSHDYRHHREADSSARTSGLAYKPKSFYAWAESKPDPYSVMSVFSRQSRYLAAGSRYADMPVGATTCTVTTTATSTATSAFVANLDLTSVKQPMVTSTEQLMHQHTAGGQTVVARTRYTRVEAVLSEKIDDGQWDHGITSDSDLSAAESSPLIQSKYLHHALPRSTESSRLDKLEERASEKSKSSAQAYSNSFESSGEDETTDFKRSSSLKNKHSTRQQHRMSETSHLSDHAHGYVRSKLEPTMAFTSGAHPAFEDTPTAVTSGRLSPRSLGNKFSASLNYLESMEESLRQVVGMERARAVAIAQQETVSVAQILKARQLEHNRELQNLQVKAQKEAKDATQDIDTLRARLEGRPRPAASSLLENEDNRRPDSRAYSVSVSSRSSGGASEENKAPTHLPPSRHNKRSSMTTTSASLVKESSLLRTAREDSYTSVKTEESIRTDLSSSSRTPSELDAHDSQASSIPEEVPEADDSYSLSFDESFTEVLPSESHRKEIRRQSGESPPISARNESSSLVTANADLSSLFAEEDSFNRFTVEMVRHIMREEASRAQHQAAVLNLREAALKEKAKAELAWLQQLKQKPRNRAADDVFPNLDKKERKIKKNLLAQQNEIRRLKEANKITSMERQLLLQQHEEIARLKENTQKTLQKLRRPAAKGEAFVRVSDVHTEEEIGETSDVSEEIKDSKSDSEVNRKTSPTRQSKRPKTGIEKQQKLRLDEKFMTTREQKLHERQKQVKELSEWKKKLDAEEEVFRQEKKAIEELEEKGKHKKKDEVITKKASKQVSASKIDDSYVISDHILSSMHEELDGPAARVRSYNVMSSVSEAVPTQISISKTETDNVSRTTAEAREGPKVEGPEAKASTEGKKSSKSLVTGGSVGSIPEEIPTVVTGDKQVVDSSDETLVNSSANDDYVDTFEPDGLSVTTSHKKSSVSKRILRGSSPLPSPWSRRTGSESESEDSISHTETVSDVSDYEVRIRQLSDELRRRRKEIEILRKERSRRQKEKLKAQEEAMQKQLDVYNRCIQQLKLEKDDLERESPLKTAVKPQIKQPKIGSHVKSKQARRSEDVSVSFDELPDSTDSAQTSPSVDGTDANVSPPDEKGKRQLPEKLIDRLSEVSVPHPDKSVVTVSKPLEGATEKTKSSSVSENIEELSHLETDRSETPKSSVFKIQDSAPALGDKFVNKISDLTKDNEIPDSTVQPSSSNSKIQSAGNGEPALGKQLISNEEISEYIEEQYSIESKSLPSPLNVSVKSEQKALVSPTATTGIQESDSENESHVNSYYTSVKSDGSSRPSSERSLASISYSPEDEEEDVISYGSDKVPPRLQNVHHDTVSAATEDVISEHISVSLPSISEKRTSHSGLLYRDMIDSLLDYKEDDQNEDADKTPVPTPRDMASTPVPDHEEENTSLLATDPLVDFTLGDHVLVGGSKPGVLRYKGTVHFSPGIWAGVELNAKEGDSDGQHEGKRYFTCSPNHGVMVHGNDIVATSEHSKVDISEIREEISVEESFSTDHDDSHIENTLRLAKPLPVASDADLVYSAPIISPNEGEPTAAGLPADTPTKKDMTLIADAITDQLAASLVEDSVKTIEKIASKKFPPPTLPKPIKAADTDQLAASLVEDSVETIASKKSPPPTLPKPAKAADTDQLAASVVEDSVETIDKIASKKSPPPTLPKPVKAADTEHKRVESPHPSPELQSQECAAVTRVLTSQEAMTVTRASTSSEHTAVVTRTDTSSEHMVVTRAVTSEQTVVTKAATSEHTTVSGTGTSTDHAAVTKYIVPEHTAVAKAATPDEHTTVAKSITLEEETTAVRAITSEEQTTVTKTLTSEEHTMVTKTLTSEEQIAVPRVLPGVPSQTNTFKTTESVIKTLLDDAIAHMLDVKKKKTDSKISTSITELLANNNNILHGEFTDQSFKSFLDDSTDEDKIQDNDSGLSLDPVQRPGSPVPPGSPSLKDRNKLNDELTGLFGEYIDDDLDFEPSTTRPPPPYPLERNVPLPEDIKPVVPHTKEEIAPIVSQAVEIYWEKRRFGESLEEVQVPPDFLLEAEDETSSDRLTVKSRRSWRMMLFDLTGEIIQDIYSSDDKPDVPVWQKPKHKPQKYFHKANPPTTIEGLQPVVHAAVFQLLGLNGSHKYNTVNKWSIRKKKDLVDAILTKELGEDELGWVNYDDEELNLKMSLAESIFDSLLLDTVHTVNGIYQKKQSAV